VVELRSAERLRRHEEEEDVKVEEGPP